MSAVVEKLSRLIGFPTISTSPVTEIAAFIGDHFANHGFTDPVLLISFDLLASIHCIVDLLTGEVLRLGLCLLTLLT